MDLRAPIGEDAVGSFVLQNKRSDPADISFIVSEFSGPDDGPLFRPPVRITPPRFSMSPRSEQAVEIRVPVLSDLFEPGKPYTATVAVRGQEALELVLTVWAEDGEHRRPAGSASGRTSPEGPGWEARDGSHRQGGGATGSEVHRPRGMKAGTRSTGAGAGRAGAAKKSTASRGDQVHGAAKKSTASRGATKKSTASRGAAKKSTASRGAAKKSTASRGAAKKSTASRGAAKKSTASRGAAKKSTASRGAAKRTTRRRTTGRG